MLNSIYDHGLHGGIILGGTFDEIVKWNSDDQSLTAAQVATNVGFMGIEALEDTTIDAIGLDNVKEWFGDDLVGTTITAGSYLLVKFSTLRVTGKCIARPMGAIDPKEIIQGPNP